MHFKLNANSALVKSNLRDVQIGLLFFNSLPSCLQHHLGHCFYPFGQPWCHRNHHCCRHRRCHLQLTPVLHNVQTMRLRQQISQTNAFGAVDEMFVRFLQTNYIGYLNVSMCDILEHLYSEYARISAADLQNNDIALKTAYNPNQPIKSLSNQVENNLDYAATGNTPYSPAQVVATAF